MGESGKLVTAWSYGLAGCIYAAFAIYLLWGRRTGIRYRALCTAVLLCALWGIAGLALALTRNAAFLSVSLIADICRFGGWYFFLLVLLKPDALENSYPVRVRWFGGVAIALVLFGLTIQVLAQLGIGIYGNLQRLALFDLLAMTVFTLTLIEQLFRNVSVDSRWSIKPLCIGLGGAILFDLYLYSDALLFNRIDADAFSIRGFVHALVVPLVAVSTVRSHDWKNRIVLSQRAALQSASLVAVGTYLLFMSSAGYYVRYFGGEWGRAFQLALLFSALLLLCFVGLSGTTRATFRVLVGKHFFRYRYDYREEWLRFTKTLSSMSGFPQMGLHVVRGLADMVESPAGALWLRDPSAKFFAQAACLNMPLATSIEDADSPLCQYLADSGWVINLEEYRFMPHRYGSLVIPAWLVGLQNAWLVVPLVTRSHLIGFVILTTSRAKIDVNWEINDLLKTAGQQAAAFLGQMQATEALLEVRKFDAFNKMSAFVVHDLKNIVAQLSLMLTNSERHSDNPEFQKDMLITVGHTVERMRKLLMQLREGTTPVDSPRGIDLVDVIKRIQTAKANQGRYLDVEFADKVMAKGHEDRVERVIGHLVQNAIDATENGGRVWLRLKRQGAHALIEVGDTGYGMTTEFIRERLFKPFQTTKANGMGIGAYESFQYVHELGGEISVDSAINIGTQVTLLLPLFDACTAMASILLDEVSA